MGAEQTCMQKALIPVEHHKPVEVTLMENHAKVSANDVKPSTTFSKYKRQHHRF
jgi:hypothetical protein